MCIPAAVVAVGSLVLGAVQARQQSRAAASQAGYQEDIGLYNARVAENQAQQIRNKGTEEENRVRQENAQLLARQRAHLGASNVALGTGSPLQLQLDTLSLGEVEAGTIRSNYEQQAIATETQGALNLSQATAQSGLTRQAGRIAATGTLLSTVGTFATGSVSNKWFNSKSAANVPAPVDNSALFPQQSRSI